jgi:site-specific recombinase XerD
MESNSFAPAIHKGIKLSQFEKEYLQNFGCNFSKPDSFVFSKSNGFPFRKEYVSKKFKNIIRKAGLAESIHFHTLRHSFVTNLIDRGAPINTVRDLAGHSSLAVTEIYCHSNLESLRNAVTRFN